ncbi:MAG: XTP/dITP diphosphatase [Dehalococcoidales bacterium]|jgi:XTP/dITP diphosphohydrolase
MPDRPKLLLATNNTGKLREYRSLLQGIPFDMVTLADEGITAEVAEIGQSFEENATLKATTLAALSGLLSLADDSGLEVDALGGEPGARSHRFAGENATDADRINHLLEKLKDAPDQIRTAQFRCVIAIAEPNGRVELCSGICRGVIIKEPRGTNGFGYDPVFLIPELNKTMAELTMEEKNLISHRSRAAEQALAKLMEW